MFLLYIDPGTGSMLFSLFMGLAAAFYFLGRTFLIRVKTLFAGGRRTGGSAHVSLAVYNEGPQYWNVFKPVLEALEQRGEEVLYLTSDEADPFFSGKFTRIKGEFIGRGNRAFARLNILQAEALLLTTPGLEVFQLKRSKFVDKYVHILHDTGDATCYRLFGIDWYDGILLSGEYQKKDIRELEKVRGLREKDLSVIGSTYLDVYQEKIKALPAEEDRPFTVLVSPSWGPGSLLQVFGDALLDPLAKTGWRILVRPHPQSKINEKETLRKLEGRYRDNPLVLWDYEGENIRSLSRADVMISDFSGIIFDYVFLFERPVLYANAFFNRELYDAGDLDHEPWKFEAVKKFGRELKQEDLADVSTAVTLACADPLLAAEREKAREIAWEHRGRSGELAADYLVSLKARITLQKE